MMESLPHVQGQRISELEWLEMEEVKLQNRQAQLMQQEDEIPQNLATRNSGRKASMHMSSLPH
jgi:hypothetical protein